MIAPAGDPALVLRDIHVPPAPPWWPPAPGWWLLAALAVALLLFWGVRAWRRHRRRAALRRLFDHTLAEAATPAARVAAMSTLLRRAARQREAGAATLEGEAWLQYLDAGARQPLFEDGHGQLLLDGAFRADVDPAAVDALRPRVRQRFLEWMGAA